MRGTLAACVVVCAGIGCGRESPPAPAPDLATQYPLDVGRTWAYRAGLGFSVTRDVARTVDEGGRTYAEMRYSLPFLGRQTLLMRHDGERVVVLWDGQEHTILRFPMKTGERWTIDLPGYPETAECEVVGPEELDLPVGKLTCTRLNVRRVNRATGRARDEAEWYHPGYGLVAMRVTHIGITLTFQLNRMQAPP